MIETNNRPELSLVIPIFNEQESLPILKDRIEKIADFPERHEIIFVSDGSTDNSTQIIDGWAINEKRIKLIVLTRNFGQQAAISAGLEFASGEYIGIIDADLQDPPEDLIKMYYEAKKEKIDIYYAIRKTREGNFIKKILYKAFYKLYEILAETPVHLNSGDFSIMSRKAVGAIVEMPEKVRFVRGLRSWLGLKEKSIEIDRKERVAGEPQYSWYKLIKLAIDGLTSFSIVPLRVASILGLIMFVSAFLLAVFYFVVAYVVSIPEKVPGFTTLVILILFLNGLTLFMLGIMGEYIGTIFQEIKKRPTFLVNRTVNLRDENKNS